MSNNVYTCVSYIFIHNEIEHFWEFERMFKKKIKSIRKWIFDLLQSKDFYIYRKIVDMNYEKIKLFET